MNITSAALSEILAAYEARIPKNSSKHAKIRKLMTLNDVKEALGDDGVARMEQKLCEIEKNRSSKKTKDTEPQGDETDAKGDDEDDPAVAACCQLLEELDAEEEEEDNKDEEKEGAAYSEQTEEPAPTAESRRASKALLSKTETVPQWLLDMYPIPPGGCIHHTRFRDTSLPLFQAKLQNAKIFEGQKQSCSFSMLRFRDSIQSLFRGNNTSAEEQHQRELQPGSECGAAEHEDQPGKNHACETEEYGTSLFLHLVLVDTSIETD
eukprot:s1222_g3.t1